MLTARVFPPTGHPVELFNISHGYVTTAGALVYHFTDADQPGRLRARLFAPGQWTDAEEWNGDDDQGEQLAAVAAEPEPEPAPEPAPADRGRPLVDEPTEPRSVFPWSVPLPAYVPSVAGSVQLPTESVGIVRDPLQMSDRHRLQQAMTVHCICEALRCPSLLLFPPDPEPRRCGLEDLHPGVHAAPIPSPWVWGPHNHHPRCPRNPEHYNRNDTLCGRLVELEGLPLVGTGCLLPWDHTGAHDHATPGAEGQPLAAAGLTVPAATIPTQRDRSAAAAAVRGELVPAGRVGLLEPPTVDRVLLAHSSPDWFFARTVGQTCAAAGAPESLGPLVCERPAGHDHGPHAAMAGTGDLIQW